MRALYTAASGMNAQQTRLDTAANNLANVNTTGFKKGRADFQDVFYQELTAGGQIAQGARAEVGSGVRLSGLERVHSGGTLTHTGDGWCGPPSVRGGRSASQRGSAPGGRVISVVAPARCASAA